MSKVARRQLMNPVVGVGKGDGEMVVGEGERGGGVSFFSGYPGRI